MPNAARRDALTLRLLSFTDAVQPRDETTSEVIGYFVITPAFATLADARQHAESLAARGVGDVAPLSRGPNRNRVSLGLYNDLANAEQRRSELAVRGIQSVIRPRTAAATEFWLDATLSQTAFEQVASGVAAQSVSAIECDPGYVQSVAGKVPD